MNYADPWAECRRAPWLRKETYCIIYMDKCSGLSEYRAEAALSSCQAEGYKNQKQGLTPLTRR